MHAWPLWGRWLTLVVTYLLFGLGLWALAEGEHVWRAAGLVVFAVAMPLMIHVGRAVMSERSRAVERRYVREFVPAMVVYMLVMLYVWPLQKGMEQGWLKAATALLPVLPIGWVIVASIRYVLGSDERERRQQLESLAIGVAIVSVVSMALGFLVAAKVMVVDSGLALLLVYPAVCLAGGAVRCLMQCRSHGE
jgi:hypothetical protein